MLQSAEHALAAAIKDIKAAMDRGATDQQLAKARELHRKAHIRWDYVSAENSMGFHSPQEALRILAESLDYSRQAQLEVRTLGR